MTFTAPMDSNCALEIVSEDDSVSKITYWVSASSPDLFKAK
ncbi:hypothetical protein [Marivirga sp.]|nr:hypothetical protein [Marivirga sp.]